jgi:hypothetical protein
VDVSAFAVAASHDTYLPVGASTVAAVVGIRASGLGEPGVDVSLRVWTPLGATLAVLREAAPGSADLRGAAVRLDDRTLECPAGRWTDGARAYELAVELPARGAGDEMLAARCGVVVAGEVVGRALIAVAWTEDERLTGAPPGGPGADDLPTAPSPPRDTPPSGSGTGAPCPACGLRPADDDRFCEGCGRELAGR